MPKPKRHDSDYPPVTTYTPIGLRKMWNEEAERAREARRLRREEVVEEGRRRREKGLEAYRRATMAGEHIDDEDAPEPPEAA